MELPPVAVGTLAEARVRLVGLGPEGAAPDEESARVALGAEAEARRGLEVRVVALDPPSRRRRTRRPGRRGRCTRRPCRPAATPLQRKTPRIAWRAPPEVSGKGTVSVCSPEAGSDVCTRLQTGLTRRARSRRRGSCALEHAHTVAETSTAFPARAGCRPACGCAADRGTRPRGRCPDVPSAQLGRRAYWARSARAPGGRGPRGAAPSRTRCRRRTRARRAGASKVAVPSAAAGRRRSRGPSCRSCPGSPRRGPSRSGGRG